MNIKWTEEDDARLKELREQFLSASEMALDFGMTRNMVIGRLRRLGLSPMSQRPNGGGGRKRNRGPDIGLLVRPSTYRPGAVIAFEKRSPLSRTRTERPSEVSLGPVTIWNVQAVQCRWPNDGSVALEGSPANTFRFCGARIDYVGCSYCEEHAKLAAPR